MASNENFRTYNLGWTLQSLTALVALVSLWTIWSESAEASVTDSGTNISSASELSSMPRFGLEITTGASGLGSQSIQNKMGGLPFSKSPIRAQVDYQPLHAFGVLSVGPTFEYFVTGVADGYQNIPHAEPGMTKAFSVGAQVRYQARFLESQSIVPMAAYSLETVSYRIPGSDGGYLPGRGLTLGAWVFLNALDRPTARGFYRELGVSRTYFTIEARRLTAEDDWVSFSGTSYQLGLRFEL